MASFPPDVWFVRSNGGSGSYPVTPEGWRVVWLFAAGAAASVVLGVMLAAVGPLWLWVAAFAGGMAASAWYFIRTARAHTDYTITYSEYMRDRNA